VLDVKVDDTTIEINGSNQVAVKADGIGSSQIADNAIDTEHLADDAVGSAEIDWGTSTNQINAASVPTGTAWEGTATDVDGALEELRDSVGNYLPLAGGTMSGDINMNGNDITNIGNTSLTFVSGAKIVSNNFDTSGNFILENEVDDSTIEWVDAQQPPDWDDFDDGVDGNAVSSTSWVGDGSDTEYDWRLVSGYSSLLYNDDYKTGETGLSAGYRVTDSAFDRIIISKIDPFSTGTYSFSADLFLESNNVYENPTAYIIWTDVAGTTAEFRLSLSADGSGNVNLYLSKMDEGKKEGDEGVIGSAAAVATIAEAASGLSIGVTLDYTNKLADVTVDSVEVISDASWTSSNASLEALKIEISSNYMGKWGTATLGGAIDNIVEPSYVPSSATPASIRIKDSGITQSKLGSNSVSTIKIIDDNVTAAKLNADVVRAGNGLLQYTDGSLYVSIDSTTMEFSTGQVTVKADGIKDTQINWGTDVFQVAADDVPVGTAWEGTATDVDGALEELRDSIGSVVVDAWKTFNVDIGDNLTASGSDTMSITSTHLTITGSASTKTLSLGIANSAVDTDQIAADAVGSAEIDWGTTGNQVAADDVPVVDSGTRFTGENVEAVLAEIYDSMTGDYLPLAGGTMSGDIDMDSNSITNLADGANPGDAVNYGQLQAVAAVSKLWKEILLISDQLVDGASGGIYAAQVLKLSANLETGDTISLYDGTNTESFIAGTDFSIGADINATLANISAEIVADSNIAISTTTTLLDSVDATNDVLILWQDTIGESTRIYGNAGAATRSLIANPTLTNVYEALSSDMVALPTTQPEATNFGFSREYASLELHETHYCRVCDSQFSWDADSQVWQQTGASSIPYASTTDWGKAKIDTDGALDVVSGVIGVNVDGSTIVINASNEIEVDSTNIINTNKGLGETSNAIEVKLTTDGGLDFDGSGNIQVDVTDTIDTNYGLTEDTNKIRINLESDGGIAFDSTNKGLEVKLDGSTLTVGSSGLKVTANGIDTSELAADAVGEAEIDWGTGTNLVDATSLPLDTGGTYGGSALNVQDALEEIEGLIPTVYSFKTISDGTNTTVADSDADTLTFISTDNSMSITVADTPETVNIILSSSVAGGGLGLTGGILSAKTDDTTIQVNLSGELEVIGTFASYAFKTISVSGQSSVVADAADDTLTFAAGNAITITTDAETDTITIDLAVDSVGGSNIARSINVDATNGVGIKVDDSTIEENVSSQLTVKFNDSGTGSADVWSAQQISRDGLMALTSGEALAIGDLIALNTSGKIVKSRANTSYYYETLGIATSAATGADETVYVKFDRVFTKTGLLTSIGSVGDVIYVSDTTAGAYTATEPTDASTVVKRVGIKLSDNDLIVSFGPTILN
jgi:hypothetical protein